MIARTEYEELLKKVEKLSEEMEDIRQLLLQEKPRNGKSGEAWNNLIEISKDISAKWEGPSVTEEISDQRTKNYDI